MYKLLYVVFILTVLRVKVAFPQLINRPPLLNLLRPVQEAIVETPLSYSPLSYSPQILEATPNVAAVSPVSPVSTISPSTTIITDCSPSVCKNLANTLQLMIVCNLLQNAQGGSDLAVQLAAPIINEVISSPNLPCGCANPFLPSPVSNPLVSPPSFGISPSITSSNVYSSLIPNNLISNYANMAVVNSNGIFYNLS